MAAESKIHRHRSIRDHARVLGVLTAVAVAAVGITVTPALAETCQNAALRAENNSTQLPECRAYEIVTPPYKEGFPAEQTTYSDDGIVAFQSIGNFAGASTGAGNNPYLATRSVTGWVTSFLHPLGSELAQSPDLRSSLWNTGSPTGGATFYARSPDGVFTRIGTDPERPELALGGIPILAGVSQDFSHVIFQHSPGTSLESSRIFELVGPEDPDSPRLVSVDNTGADTEANVCPDSMSADGRVIVFTSGCQGVGTPALWARVGGSASVLISASECTRTAGDPGGPCNAQAPWEYAGATKDGSRVFLTTTRQLVNGDTDQSTDLYECAIPAGAPTPIGIANPCASLTDVSHNATGAEVLSVVDISEDGSRVYFVAKGVLAANLGSNDAEGVSGEHVPAVAGDANLYVWEKDAAHPAGQTTFVAKLESDDIRAQSNADGRYLVFNTASRLLASDTDEMTDVYRYDAVTGRLLRLSTDTSGGGGNESGFEARIGTVTRPNRPHSAMTDDGGTVVFETREALSPADIDGTFDVYEWHEGQVSLISNGDGEARVPSITSSGQDIFFQTGKPLVPSDSGLESDIYDARIDGGFAMGEPAPCSDEACLGAIGSQPQPPGGPTTATVTGPGSSITAETPPVNTKPKPHAVAQKLARALRACRSKHNHKRRSACEKQARKSYRRAK